MRTSRTTPRSVSIARVASRPAITASVINLTLVTAAFLFVGAVVLGLVP